MGGIQYDFEDRWKLRSSGSLTYQRLRPGRIRDREAFSAVIKAVRDVAGGTPNITVNDHETTSDDALTILDDAGPTVLNLFISSADRSFNVMFYVRPRSITTVSGPITRGGELNRLTSIVDAHTRWLGWRSPFARVRTLRWAAPSVIVRATRDARLEARARWTASVFGFLGGVAASLLSSRVSSGIGLG